MAQHWYREGSFSTRSSAESNPVTHQVRFKNNRPTVLIKQIEIIRHQNKLITVFELTPFHCSEISTIWREFFFEEVSIQGLIKNRCKRVQFDITKDELRATIEKFNQFCTYINSYYERCEFPTELLLDLTNIITFAFKFEEEEVLFDHMIPEKQVSLAHVNPYKKESLELIEITKDKISPRAFTKFKILLASGENPNQKSRHMGQSLMLLIVQLGENSVSKKTQLKMVELLLWYNNMAQDVVFSRDNGLFWESPMERAYQEIPRNPEIYALFVRTFSTIKKSPTCNNPQIANITLSTDINKIITTFEIAEKPIFSIFQPTAILTAAEHECLLPLFAQEFQAKKGYDLLAILTDEISGKDKFIELIRDHKDLMVGFNLFHFFTSPQLPNHIFVCCVFSQIIPQYRRTGIMALTMLRPALTLGIASQSHIIFCYQAAAYASYQLANELAHHPKNKSFHMTKALYVMLKSIYGEDSFSLVQDQTALSVMEEETQVKPGDDKSSSIQKKCYEEYIMGGNKGFFSAPVLFYADKICFEKYQKRAKNYGVNLLSFIKEFSPHLKKLVEDNCHNILPKKPIRISKILAHLGFNYGDHRKNKPLEPEAYPNLSHKFWGDELQNNRIARL